MRKKNSKMWTINKNQKSKKRNKCTANRKLYTVYSLHFTEDCKWFKWYSVLYTVYRIHFIWKKNCKALSVNHNSKQKKVNRKQITINNKHYGKGTNKNQVVFLLLRDRAQIISATNG